MQRQITKSQLLAMLGNAPRLVSIGLDGHDIERFSFANIKDGDVIKVKKMDSYVLVTRRTSPFKSRLSRIVYTKQTMLFAPAFN